MERDGVTVVCWRRGSIAGDGAATGEDGITPVGDVDQGTEVDDLHVE